MNINIAFNTIIYIMVFLFPGVLYRRMFFSGKFNKHFDSSNAFERILYYLLTSIACIFCFCFFVGLVDGWIDGGVKVFHTFSSDTLIKSFIAIYKNEFPTILETSDNILRLTYLLFSLYLFSALTGYLSNKVVLSFALERRWSFFQFLNKWENLSTSTFQNNNAHKVGDMYTTKIDIATDDNCLFTGRLHDIIFGKDGNIEAYALLDTFKFYRLNKADTDAQIQIQTIKELLAKKNPYYVQHLETDSSYIYLKRIKGNIFTIGANKVQNTSLTFVRISGLYERLQKYFRIVVPIVLASVIVFSISYLFWDYHLFEFETSYKKIGFCIALPLTTVAIVSLVLNTFAPQNEKAKYWKSIKESFFVSILFTLPYFYIFGDLAFYWLLLIEAIIIILYAMWNSDRDQ